MDSWLDQVDVCDGVVSIANTTIHGAGSLKTNPLPPWCKLTRMAMHKDEKFSYWYPTVEIAWERRK